MNTQGNSLRLLFYCPALADGGAERVWALLAGALAARGHDVVLAVDGEAPHGPAAPEGARLTVLGGGHLANVRRLRRLLRDFAPQAALSALAASPLKLTLAAAGSGIPLIHAFHGFEEWRTGRLSHLTWRLLPLLSRRAAAVVAVSDALRKALVEDWGAAAEKTLRIYNPLALPHPLPDAGDLSRRPPEVLAIGRLSGEKGFGLLLRAFALLRTPEARLTILGEGPLRPHLEELAENLGIAPRVRFAGWQADVWPHLRRARALALASRSESFGNVVVEALAAGLPVVATDTPGPREILGGDARLGRLVPLTDAAAMAAALEAFLADPGDPAPRQERAEDFSAARGVARWEELIRTLGGVPS